GEDEISLLTMPDFEVTRDSADEMQTEVYRKAEKMRQVLYSLPVRMTVCWDSVIDKKAYETEIWFSRDTWQQMLTAYPDTYKP
ncbi:DUF2931 family protein, partial [Escherichia coli]|nr:DUF2931 family protein [Escherichia coli]